METLTIYNIITTIFSSFAFFSNFGSLIYIIKSFDTKQSFFHILCLDAMLVMGSALISLIMFSVAISGEVLDGVSCSFLLFGTQIPVFTSPTCNLMVSFIRYKKLIDIQNSWFSNKQLVKGSSAILALVLLYGLLIAFINSYFELRSFNIYSVCLEGQKAQMNHVTFNIFTVLLPLLFVVATTNFMDFSSYLWLQRTVHPEQENQGCIVNDIPLRATLISTHLLLLYIGGFVVLGSQNISPAEKYLVAIIATRINDMLRNPLVAIYTFKINDETRQKNAIEERERKRQIEIKNAFSTSRRAKEDNDRLKCIELEERNPDSIWDGNKCHAIRILCLIESWTRF